MFPKTHNYRVSNPKSQKGRNGDSPKEIPTCGKCGKKHAGKCLVRMNTFYSCCKSVHIVKDCHNMKVQVKGENQSQ